MFIGARKDRVFKLGHLGLGYYIDTALWLVPEVREKLPERWRDCSLREERLKVCKKKGLGLEVDACDYGFLVEQVEAEPGQPLAAGEVIVAVEGRLLAGLSGPQMQASFLKRKIDGARLAVASFQEVKHRSERDPAIVENWDANYQRAWYFDKRTGQSSWVYDELAAAAPKQEAAVGAGQENKTAKGAAAVGQVDLATFLSHGFAAQPVGPAKKKKKTQEKKEAADAALKKDDSDLAREEKKRWDEWNEGKRGGYTDMFLDKYKNCTSWVNMKEDKKDKRMKGSVGPGNGMEYMARWTGSKNSFN